jgi:hypothetical protein
MNFRLSEKKRQNFGYFQGFANIQARGSLQAF